MLDLRLFRNPSFTATMLAGALLSAGAFSASPYVSVWLQSVLDLSAIQAGLVLIPMSVAAFLVSALAGRFTHGWQPRYTVGFGLIVIGVGTLGQAVLTAGSGWAVLVPGIAVTGLGVGLAIPSLASAALASVPVERSGMASGAINTSRQLGFALGIAVLGGLLRNGLTSSLSGSPASGTAGAIGGGQSHLVIAQAPAAAKASVEHAIRAAFADSLDTVFLVAGGTGIVAGLIVLLLVRPTAPRPAPQAQETSVEEAPAHA
jgi:predicted MFS family arabinose efflux permease